MIVVLKLTNGEEIVGCVENDDVPVHQLELINLLDPMYIVDQKDEVGHSVMRLEDALLLSDDEYLTFKQKDVITYYKPAPKLCDYYSKASVYAKNYAKPRLHKQITGAIRELETIMNEQSDPWENFMNTVYSKNKKH